MLRGIEDLPCRAVGIDVGGTFTDFVAALDDRRLLHHKEPSTPRDPSLAIEKGLRALLDQGARLGPGSLIVHGTTIALNAILQRDVARIALVVSRGARDVLEIARCRMPSSFDLRIGKPAPIVPRDRVLEVDARITAAGKVMAEPDAAALDALCDRLAALEVEAVAIMLLHSYLNPAPEDRIAAALARRLPHLLVSCSARVWPEIREYERTVVACLNAQVHPLMDRYLANLSTRIAGLATGAVLQLASSAGGSVSLHSARQRPVETMLSGPACGVAAAARIAKRAGIAAAVTFDMGGTSADISVLSEGEIEFTTAAQIGDLPLMMPVVSVNSIGAGGGSIVSLDAQGVIKVGPESAGAQPGPVCYGLGGTRPTVTDCYLALGIIDPEAFLGGRLVLDRAAAEAALSEIARRLGLAGPAAAAEAALRVATARMAAELFKLIAQRGREPSQHMVMPFGGAGPTHAVLLADEAGLSGIAVPPAAATFCALGAALADVRREFVIGFRPALLASFKAALWENWRDLEVEARRWLGAEGIAIRRQRLEYAADMRYAGQSHNLLIRVPAAARESEDAAEVAAGFHAAHEAIYGFREGDEAVELVTQRLSIIGEMPPVELPSLSRNGTAPERGSSRPVYHRGAWVEAAVHRRERLAAGARLAGPVIIEQDDTTTWVPPGWRLTVDEIGLLLIRRSDDDAA